MFTGIVQAVGKILSVQPFVVDAGEVSGGVEEPGVFKALCGPKGTCECSHRYRPEWKNAVKGFRCIAGNAQVTSIQKPQGDIP